MKFPISNQNFCTESTKLTNLSGMFLEHEQIFNTLEYATVNDDE